MRINEPPDVLIFGLSANIKQEVSVDEPGERLDVAHHSVRTFIDSVNLITDDTAEL